MHRQRIDVVVFKGNELVLGYSQENDQFRFAGGGIEDGQSMEEAVTMECLEELGVRVKDIRKVSMAPFVNDWSDDKEKTLSNYIPTLKVFKRMQKYVGTVTTFIVAEFDQFDTSLYGKDGDSLIPVVVPVQLGKELLMESNHTITNHRMKALDCL